jgi:hypothetical protein
MRGVMLVMGCVIVAMIPSVLYAQSCQESVLHNEFFTDPTTRNYVSCASDGDLAGPNVSDTCVLNFFNAPCTVAACKVDNILTREQIYETIIDGTELDNLANGTAPADIKHQRELSWLLTGLTWNMAKNASQKHWKNPFPAATAPLTNAAIDAAKQRDAPRSQIVCSRLGTINDVSCGLRGTACP